jgi:hypothetical protein
VLRVERPTEQEVHWVEEPAHLLHHSLVVLHLEAGAEPVLWVGVYRGGSHVVVDPLEVVVVVDMVRSDSLQVGQEVVLLVVL